HEAVMQVNDDSHADDTVIEEFQKGYQLKQRVIRPSMVKVVKN
ncbi:MAG: nucleotide exchange factor GrpE, partial [Bacillota bacterium]